jgi:uncharacterized protein
MPAIVLDSRGTPGYEFYVDSAGPTIPVVSVYSRLYLLIHATMTTPVVEVGVPTVVGTMDDFTNLFGSSDAIVLNSIEVFLLNFQQGLYIIRAEPSPYITVTVTASAGDKTITINGTAITITPDASPTLQEIITALVNTINDEEAVNLDVEAEYNLTNAGLPNYAGGTFRLRSKTGASFTAVGSTGITVSALTTPTTMQYWDWVAALRDLTQYEDDDLGFLACPQAFLQLTNQFERTQVGNTMEETARKLGWFAYIDPHDPATIDHPRKAKTDAAGYLARQGHSAYTYPYFLDRDLDLVAPSVAIPAVALRRYQKRGIQEPPAGVECAIDGVSGVQYTLNTAQKVDLADANVNINVFQPGVGSMPYDTLTRSTDPAFLMINGRIILSSYERTLRNTLRASKLLFRAIDGVGRFYSLLRLTVTGVTDLFYRAGALYGAAPGDAYYVQCDAAMQEPANLERGIVVFNVYLVPVPISRRIKGYIYRVQIDQIAQTVAIEAL